MCCLFVSPILGQSFYDKHNKQILVATVGIALIIIYKLKKDNAISKREIWRKKNTIFNQDVQTDNSDSTSEKLEKEKYIYPKEIKKS